MPQKKLEKLNLEQMMLHYKKLALLELGEPEIHWEILHYLRDIVNRYNDLLDYLAYREQTEQGMWLPADAPQNIFPFLRVGESILFNGLQARNWSDNAHDAVVIVDAPRDDSGFETSVREALRVARRVVVVGYKGEAEKAEKFIDSLGYHWLETGSTPNYYVIDKEEQHGKSSEGKERSQGSLARRLGFRQGTRSVRHEN